MGPGQDIKWRVFAAWAHWRITGQAEPSLAVFSEAVTKGAAAARTVLMSVNHLGPEARAAVPLLERLLPDAYDPADYQTSFVAVALESVLGRSGAVEVLAGHIGPAGAAQVFTTADRRRRDD